MKDLYHDALHFAFRILYPPVVEQLRRTLWGLGGMVFLMTVAWLLSDNKKKIPWRVVGWGVGLQLLFAFLILHTPAGRYVFDLARRLVEGLLKFTDAGAGFLFGNLYQGVEEPGKTPLMLYDPSRGAFVPVGLVFVFHVLMTIVFFASLMSVFYHLGLMQRVVGAIAWVMRRCMGTSGAETLSASANIFVGQTEAPLVVKPYVDRMTRSELMAVMTGGFATIAGGVLMVYARLGIDAGHLLAASVMSAPAALLFAKLIVPETETAETAGGAKLAMERQASNVIEAAAAGAADGIKLALNVAAMLMAFLALIAVINFGLGWIGDRFGLSEKLTLARIFGIVFSPFALMIGIPWSEASDVGNLLGTKIAVNEFIAYLQLDGMRETISPRSFDIATYALCGFANFGSIAIQIGGISGIAPGRRADLARLGLRAMIAGALASWQTAAIAGIFIDPEDSARRRDEQTAEQPWTRQRLNFQQQIDTYEKMIAEYPDTEWAKQAAARIPALRREAAQTYGAMRATAQRLEREGRANEAAAIYRRVIDEFTTPERVDAYLADRGLLEVLREPQSPKYNLDEALHIARRLAARYAVPVEERKEDSIDARLDAFDAALDAWAIELRVLDARTQLNRLGSTAR
jgi:CNT family concentrative nucleoside transporter